MKPKNTLSTTFFNTLPHQRKNYYLRPPMLRAVLRYFLLLAIMMFCCNELSFAQATKTDKDTLFSIIGSDSLYFGNKPGYITTSLVYDYPGTFGICAGYEKPFRSKRVTIKLPKGKIKIREADYNLNFHLYFFRQPGYQSSLWLNPGYGIRHQKKKWFYYETIIHLGYLRTFYDGTVYVEDAAGNISERGLFGRGYWTLGVSPTFGANMEQLNKKHRYAYFLKLNLWAQYPFTNVLVPHAMLEAGIKFHMKDSETGILRTGFYVKEKVRKPKQKKEEKEKSKTKKIKSVF